MKNEQLTSPITFVGRLLRLFLRTSPYLRASISFAFISIIVLYFVESRISSESSISHVLIVIFGMTTMASFTYFHSYIWTESTKRKTQKVDEIVSNNLTALNEEFIQQNITFAFSKIIDKRFLSENRHRRISEQNKESSWQVSSNDLVGFDNPLALAKLRIDFENELRRLASRFEIDFIERTATSGTLTKKLIEVGVLPPESMGPIREVMEICNKGVHGFEISTEETAKVIELGNELIDNFRSIDEKYVKSKNFE